MFSALRSTSRALASSSLVPRTVSGAVAEVPAGAPFALAPLLQFQRWATKKAGGVSSNGRDSQPKYLGLKKYGGEKVFPGNIIVRQRGCKFHPGKNVGLGKDHTIWALKPGNVQFEWVKVKLHHKKKRQDRCFINVVEAAQPTQATQSEPQ